MDDARLMKDVAALQRAQTVSANWTIVIPLFLAGVGVLSLLLVMAAAFMVSPLATGILLALLIGMVAAGKLTGAGEGVLAGAVALIGIAVGLFSITAAVYTLGMH